MQSSNITWDESKYSKEERSKKVGQSGKIFWFTGLSGSGKSTIARIVERKLLDKGLQAYTLDGDNLRFGLNGDLGFSNEDRKENIRRVGEVAKLFCDANVLCLCSFISPFEKDRQWVRSLVGNDEFLEIYVATSLDECERRDVKGLYKRARTGEITDFTGISSPYEVPKDPDIILQTQSLTPEQSAQQVIDFLEASTT